MKTHLDPLGKGKKKPDLEGEIIKDSIEETGKESRTKTERTNYSWNPITGFRILEDAVVREAKPGYKVGNEAIDKANEESKEYEDKKYDSRIKDMERTIQELKQYRDELMAENDKDGKNDPLIKEIYSRIEKMQESSYNLKVEKLTKKGLREGQYEEHEKADKEIEINQTLEEKIEEEKEKSIIEEYNQTYGQKIREAVSEGNFNRALEIYNFLKALNKEPELRNIMQEGAGKKEGLEEKVTEGEQEEQKAGEEQGEEKPEEKAEEKKEKKPFFKSLYERIKDHFSEKPATTLYVGRGFFLNKWTGCFVPGAKIANENWKIQGRPGWKSKFWPFQDKIWFGRPGWYNKKPIDTKFTHYVYERNYLDEKAGEKPGKKLLYKISDKILEKVPKDIRKRGDKEEVLDAQIMLNCGKSYYGELWKKDPRPTHKEWDIWTKICEDFYKEHTESTKNMANSYANGKNGMICLDTTIEGGGRYILREQPKKGMRGLVNWGRLYHLIIPGETGEGGEKFTDTFFLNKHAVASVFLGKKFSIYNNFKLFKKRKLAAINKQRIKTWLHLGRPHYKIHIYDEELAKDEKFKQILALMVPYLEKERQYHKLRYKFKGDEPGPYSTLSLSHKYSGKLTQKNIWGR